MNNGFVEGFLKNSILLNSIVHKVYLSRYVGCSKKEEPVSVSSSYKKPIKIAFICDEMTWYDYSPLCEAIFLRPDQWKKQLDTFNPKILFCESCWSGVPPFENSWRGRIYKNTKVFFENRRELSEILKACKQKEITTVFWNKEDPPGYIDDRYDFVDTALWFDHIFTTAKECIELYRKKGHKSVHLLPFLVNTEMFYPNNDNRVEGTAVFAGSWNSDQPERCSTLIKLLDYAIRQGWKLDIYDRHYYSPEKKFRFPERYKKYILPAVHYVKMPEIARKYEWAINVNTVTSSETMMSRRVLQMASSGAKVLTNITPAIQKLPGYKSISIGNQMMAAIIDWLGVESNEDYSVINGEELVLQCVQK